LIVEQNQNTSWFDRCGLYCSASDNFRELLVSFPIFAGRVFTQTSLAVVAGAVFFSWTTGVGGLLAMYFW
jgi:hypothetical protein